MNTAQAQQFASLQRATSNNHNDAKAADQMRARETESTSRAIEQNRHDEEGLRIAHGELGEETRKGKNLAIERERIVNAAESDRRSIIKITSELRGIEAEEREQKIQFVKEMEAINDENDFILTQRENRMMSHLIDAETVRWLVAEMLGPAAAMDGYGMIDGGVIDAEMMHATTATMAVDDHGEGNNSEGGYAARVKDASADLIEIMGRRDELTKRATELEISLDQLRAKFLLENSNLGQVEIKNLEATWMRQYDDDDAVQEGRGKKSMNCDGEKKAASGLLPGGPSTMIHMDLFYNNDDHEHSGDDMHDARSEIGIESA